MAEGLLSLGLMAMWGLVHSLLAARRVKQVLEPKLGRGYRLFYNLAAGVTLLPVLALTAWRPGEVLYQVPSPWRWGMMALQLWAVLAAAVTLLQTDIWRFLGLRQLLQPQPLAPNRLTVNGFYRWVRHPLYFFSLVLLWFSPLMTVNLLILYLAFSLYFYIGAIFEERKLVGQFGPAYQAYQQRTPMLIPWKMTKIIPEMRGMGD